MNENRNSKGQFVSEPETDSPEISEVDTIYEKIEIVEGSLEEMEQGQEGQEEAISELKEELSDLYHEHKIAENMEFPKNSISELMDTIERLVKENSEQDRKIEEKNIHIQILEQALSKAIKDHAKLLCAASPLLP